MLRTSERELRARPAALPALLHLFSALLSIIAHEPKVPQGTAFWREPDGIICNVGVKLIMTVVTARVESSVTSVTLQRVLQAVSQGRPAPVMRTSKHSDKAEVLPRALCSVMLPRHLHSACRPLPRPHKLWAPMAKQQGLLTAGRPLKLSVFLS